MATKTARFMVTVGNEWRPGASAEENEWTLFLASHASPSSPAPRAVRAVRALLHPSFSPSEVEMHRDDDGVFRWTATGWGTFRVRLLLTVDGNVGSAPAVEHDLVFEDGGASKRVGFTARLALEEPRPTGTVVEAEEAVVEGQVQVHGWSKSARSYRAGGSTHCTIDGQLARAMNASGDGQEADEERAFAALRPHDGRQVVARGRFATIHRVIDYNDGGQHPRVSDIDEDGKGHTSTRIFLFTSVEAQA